MLYNDLDKIPLDIFIDVCSGEIGKLVITGNHSEEELAEQANILIGEYVQIVGGSSLLAEISQKNTIINLHIKIECMRGCEVMIQSGNWQGAAKTLSSLGFHMFPSEHDKIRKKVSSILANSRYMLERASRKKEENAGGKMDKDYFVRERVAVIAHYGMQIRKTDISAKEYAYMVKKMCEDVKRMRIQTKKKK